jgi:hypothetical protein
VGAIFDDTEKYTGDARGLRNAIAMVTQYVPGGNSKELLEDPARNGVTPSRWLTWG